MCEKCVSNEGHNATPTRPLNRYDYGVAFFGFLHNMFVVLVEVTSSITMMMAWNSRVDEYRKNWQESLARDIEKLEVDNG